MRQFKLAAVMVVVALAACTPQKVDPTLAIVPSPRTIDGEGQTSTVRISTTDENGKPGTGTVSITSVAGSLKNGAEISLDNGAGEVDFSCARATDSDCTGTVKLTATWNGTSSSTNVTIKPATVDAGTVVDAGSVLPSTDGGAPTTTLISLQAAKTTLLSGSGDSTNVVVRFTTNTTGALPISDIVQLTVNGGASFTGTGTTSTTSVTTDANGTANVTVFAGSADGNFTLTAAGRDASASLTLLALSVGGIEYSSASLKSINVASLGVQTSSTLSFLVRDNAGNPLSGIAVSMRLGSNPAAGCGISPTSGISDTAGVVRTTLRSGDSTGIVSVVAEIAGRPSAQSDGINIVRGRVNDEHLQLSCARKTLGGFEDTNPPRTDIATTCQVILGDRDGIAPNYPVTVNWKTEAGTITGGAPSGAGSQSATANFSTGGALPRDTSPISGEPSQGTHNPRDGFVTIIASVPGEETFYDGSGTSNGVSNGKWDPGEYFIDLAEPFVDSNDNGEWDTGEEWTDTERFDCSTGVSLGFDRQWNPPNGCWDGNTQVWRSVHVVYSDTLAGGAMSSPHVTARSLSGTTLNSPVPANSALSVSMTDENFNRLSPDGLSVSIIDLATGQSGGTIITPPSSGESFGGHVIDYAVVKATETSPGVFTENGPCDWDTGTDAGYPATRCVRTVKIGGWQTSPTTTVLTVPAGSYLLKVGNQYYDGTSVQFSAN